MTSMKRTRPVVLVAIDWYLPAYRAGGPIAASPTWWPPWAMKSTSGSCAATATSGIRGPARAHNWTPLGNAPSSTCPKSMDGRQLEGPYSKRCNPTGFTSTACTAGHSADCPGRWPNHGCPHHAGSPGHARSRRPVHQTLAQKGVADCPTLVRQLRTHHLARQHRARTERNQSVVSKGAGSHCPELCRFPMTPSPAHHKRTPSTC